MNDHLYEDVALERLLAAQFGVNASVDSMIARAIPVGRSGKASLFLTNKKQLMLYVQSDTKMLMGDVRKVVSRVGLVADTYLPPKDQPDYFTAIATRKFQEVFPGRRAVNEEDIAFYKTLVPYSPALVLIREVKTGTIYQYDSDASGEWRPHAKFSYRRIATS